MRIICSQTVCAGRETVGSILKRCMFVRVTAAGHSVAISESAHCLSCRIRGAVLYAIERHKDQAVVFTVLSNGR